MKRAILSASNLGAADLCAAKPRLEAPFAEKQTEWSERGTRLHRYFLTGLDRSELSIDDRDLLERAEALAVSVVEQFKATVGIENDGEPVKFHEVEMEGLVPGHADCILEWRHGRYALILDLKSGIIPADDAADNYQLGAYAALQWERKRFHICGVAIIQPDAFGPRRTLAIYEDHQMHAVLAEIATIHARTQDPDAQPEAGEKQCRYCRAKAVCPAYREKFESLPAVVLPKSIETLDNSDLVKVYQAIQFANRIADDVREELRRRIANGDIPGKLRSTGSTRTLENAQGLWEAMLDRYSANSGWSATAYDACRKLSFGEFESLIQSLEGCTQKRAKEIAKEIAAPFVTETPKQPIPILEQ